MKHALWVSLCRVASHVTSELGYEDGPLWRLSRPWVYACHEGDWFLLGMKDNESEADLALQVPRQMLEECCWFPELVDSLPVNCKKPSDADLFRLGAGGE